MKTAKTVVTLNDIAAELQVKVDEIDALLSDIYTVVKRGMIEKFTAVGGCTHCRGRHVIRGTLDYVDYTCSHCTAEDAQRTGVCPSEGAKYEPDSLYDDEVNRSDLYRAMTGEILAERADYSSLLRVVKANAQPRHAEEIRGCDVLVVKGVKVPRGTVGRVNFVSNGTYGSYLSITTAAGERYKVALGNCEIVYDPKRHKLA